MDLLIVVLVCVAIGFVTWYLTTRVPMPSGYARTLQVLVLILLVVWVLSVAGGLRLPNVLTR